MPIIVDTDPGIDDAIALLYALRAGFDVAAITTLAGNIGLPATTRNAGRILALAEADLPVHPGAAFPLRGEARPTTGIHGDDGLGGVAFPEPWRLAEGESARDAMARLIGAAPAGAITLFCLGPLTNLASLIAAAPGIAARLGPVIAMGGAVAEPGNVGPRAEFNIAHDPEAAAQVFAAGLDLTLIPLDATRRLRADAAYVASLDAVPAPAAKAAAALIRAYFAATEGAESRPLHDPCVPLLFQRPELFRIEEHALKVDTATGALDPGPHRLKVAMGLDAEALRAELRRGLAA